LEEVIGKSPRILQSGLQDSDFYRELWSELLAIGHWQGQIFNRKKSGEIYAEWLEASTVLDKEGKVVGYSAVFYDLTPLDPASQKYFNLSIASQSNRPLTTAESDQRAEPVASRRKNEPSKVH